MKLQVTTYKSRGYQSFKRPGWNPSTIYFIHRNTNSQHTTWRSTIWVLSIISGKNIRIWLIYLCTGRFIYYKSIL